MKLSDQLLDEFIALYEKHYGVVLERDVALAKGLQLCRFVELVAFEPKDEKRYGRIED
jgi:hypothetical protein